MPSRLLQINIRVALSDVTVAKYGTMEARLKNSQPQDPVAFNRICILTPLPIVR